MLPAPAMTESQGIEAQGLVGVVVVEPVPPAVPPPMLPPAAGMFGCAESGT